MKNEKNVYRYETSSGWHTGFFNIYQARNGCIWLQMNARVVPLTLDQLNTLSIELYDLIDFDHNDFKTFYNII